MKKIYLFRKRTIVMQRKTKKSVMNSSTPTMTWTLPPKPSKPSGNTGRKRRWRKRISPKKMSPKKNKKIKKTKKTKKRRRHKHQNQKNKLNRISPRKRKHMIGIKRKTKRLVMNFLTLIKTWITLHKQFKQNGNIEKRKEIKKKKSLKKKNKLK